MLSAIRLLQLIPSKKLRMILMLDFQQKAGLTVIKSLIKLTQTHSFLDMHGMYIRRFL